MIAKRLLTWLSRNKPTPRYGRQINFIAQRDGELEGMLKARLCELFDSHELIKRAYLVLVEYTDDDISPRVALCLSCLGLIDEEEMIADITAVFEDFRDFCDPYLFLDVVFLMNVQEQEIIRISQPFYTR